MSLFSSIYLGKSGVFGSSRKMTVIGDNVSNLESTGFRGSRASFQDVFLSATQQTSPLDGRGLGVNTADIQILFNQGAIRVTDAPTDLAILGEGFFMVSNGEEVFYTRDGHFRLDEDPDTGLVRLINAYDMVLQGWSADEDPETNDVHDITIPRRILGQETSKITLYANLDSRAPLEEINDPIIDHWDGTQEEPLSAGLYDFVYNMQIVDPLGDWHDLAIYFDRTDSNNTYEYLITIDPNEDWRNTSGPQPGSGLLMYGELSFNNSGQLVSMTGYRITDLSGTREEVTPNEDGLLSFLVNFTGTPQEIAFDMGIFYDAQGESWEAAAVRTTQYATASAVIYGEQNGYGVGFLDTVSIADDGTISATYTNGQIETVGRVALADFASLDILSRVGGNLFRAPTDYEPTIFPPGKDYPGSIQSGALENSNVDLATEMIELISAQRAFQTNIRVITTASDMLEEFIQSKR
ncbi:flagellar hook protein FlgE [Thermosulfuriphilus sp.]